MANPFIDPDAAPTEEDPEEILLHAMSHGSTALHLLEQYDAVRGKKSRVTKLFVKLIDVCIDAIEYRRARRYGTTVGPGQTIPSPRPTPSRC